MALQRELKKKQPFESPQQEAVLNVLRTSDQYQVRFIRLFRPYGLTPSQYNVLRILRGEGQPLPILEIAARTITVVPGITGLIDRLEEAGFVKRERCREDRRVIWVALDRKGPQDPDGPRPAAGGTPQAAHRSSHPGGTQGTRPAFGEGPSGPG